MCSPRQSWHTMNQHPSIPHREAPISRRDFLARSGGGFGMLALLAMMEQDAKSSAKKSHFPATAKSVIWCFMDGGPSHLDLFDPKPLLTKLHGKPLPSTFKRPITPMGRTAFTPLLASKRKFKQHGESGTWVSDWYPEIAKCVDDIAVIRSCHADGLNHVGSVCQMCTGSILGGRPSLGAWATYGLGSVSENLPGFVVLLDNPSDPPGGSRNWGTGFMPATHQGTKFREGKEPILFLNPPRGRDDTQRAKIDFIQELNRRHQKQREQDANLDARIDTYELAWRMQKYAPEAVDLSQESAGIKKLYGLENKTTSAFGRNCLLARRLVERGVRFVQVFSGAGSKWDAHRNVEGNHGLHCRETDQPIAALLKDLKQRGMLDETLVVWGGEFGRTPMSESGNGRDHNPFGFSMWMAGGGVKGGVVHGSTDELGLWKTENPVHVHDFHATILHCLGIDHLDLTYFHSGRDERATVNGGKVVKAILR